MLFQWYVFEGHKEKYFRSALNIKASLANQKIVSDEIFSDQNEWVRLEKILNSKIRSDSSFFKKFLQHCYQYSEKLINTSREIGQTKYLKQLRNTELLSLYRKYQDSVLDTMPFLNGTLVMDIVLKKRIVEVLEGDLGIKNKKGQNLLLSKLVIPKKKSFFVLETEDLLKMALKLQENRKADIKQDIQNCLSKYAWMPSIAYLNPFLTEEDVIEKIKKLLKENPKERVAQIKKIKTESQKNYKEAFSQIKSSQKLVELIDLAREFIYLQTYRFDVFSIAHYHIYLLLEEIGKRFDLKVKELVYLTGDEIINLLRGKTTVDKEEVNQRISSYALIKEGNKYTLLSGNKVKRVVQKVVKAITVRGTVASQGRATGKAKLVTEVEDITKVNKGDIIISPMTYPKLMPAIIRAAGIITDFGGILCHAAIISREFGIPCIVGTKKATKVFKDGDLVELDAYSGVARKI